MSEDLRTDRTDSRELAESVYYDHPDMHTGRTSKEQKVTAAVSYLLGNSCNDAAKIAGVSKATFFRWKHRSEWWPELLDHLKRHHDEDLEARTTGVINKALENLEDRIVHGDAVWDAKNDKMVRKPVGARDLAITLGTVYDKRQLMRSQPTSISDNASEASRLEKLKKQFADLAEKKVNAIDGEYTEIREDADRNGKLWEGADGEENAEEENHAA